MARTNSKKSMRKPQFIDFWMSSPWKNDWKNQHRKYNRSINYFDIILHTNAIDPKWTRQKCVQQMKGLYQSRREHSFNKLYLLCGKHLRCECAITSFAVNGSYNWASMLLYRTQDIRLHPLWLCTTSNGDVIPMKNLFGCVHYRVIRNIFR